MGTLANSSKSATNVHLIAPTPGASSQDDFFLPENTRPVTFPQHLTYEVLSCASHAHTRYEPRERNARSRDLRTGVLLNTIAGFLGFLHLMFAVVTFFGTLVHRAAGRNRASCDATYGVGSCVSARRKV